MDTANRIGAKVTTTTITVARDGLQHTTASADKLMVEDSGAMTLVSTVISLAHSLKLNTVAEGVETEAQARLLAELRCDEIQGYLVSKPLAFEDMTAYLSRKQQ